MTTETDDNDARTLIEALDHLSDVWVADCKPAGSFSQQARASWRRKVALSSASSLIVIAAFVMAGVALLPSSRAGREATISAKPSPDVPAGYTAEAMGSMASTQGKDLLLNDKEQSLPGFVPIVDSHGLIGITGLPGQDYRQISPIWGDDTLVVQKGSPPSDTGQFGFLMGRGPDQPLLLTWDKPKTPLAVGQVVVDNDHPGGIPVGTITKILPAAYPDLLASRAEVTPLANLDHPGEVWALRQPRDVRNTGSVTTPAEATPWHPDTPLTAAQPILRAEGFSISDYPAKNSQTGGSEICTTITGNGNNGTGCGASRSPAAAAADFSLGGNDHPLVHDLPSPTSGPQTLTWTAGQAGASVARLDVVLADGTVVRASLGSDQLRHAQVWLAAWHSDVPAEKALAYDASGHLVSTTLTAYGRAASH